MSIELVAGIVSQSLLALAWTADFVITMRAYLQFRLEKMRRSEDTMVSQAVRIERAYFTFAFIFLPALMVWLPMIGMMSPEDRFYLPAVLAWLVILVFGSVQFHVGLSPTRAAWMSALGSVDPDPLATAIMKERASGKEPGRNV